jgi:TM2 domain-containing membrane protein YozV
LLRFQLIFLLSIACIKMQAKQTTTLIYYLDSAQHIISTEYVELSDNKPNPIFKLFKKKQRLNKQITAAALAFPFPFGIVGLHRIYLGTSPHVPVVYIGTLGGIFGLLPLMDFFAITFSKDFEHYRNNGNVFMWIKD